MSTPAEAGPYDECANCNHYPAYHRSIDGKPKCLAWDPDQPNAKCACPGWKPKPPAPAPPPPTPEATW